MENNKKGFEYTYSAKEQEQIRQIRSKYETRDEGKMERLIRLDRSVTKKATCWSLLVGILGALIMGAGMSLVMTDLGNRLGSASLAVGIGVGAIGMILAILAYPIYNHIVKKERARIAPEIIRLTDELIK